MTVPLWLRELIHFGLWTLPVYLAAYFCDSLRVGLLWSLMLPWGVGIILILFTIQAEIQELHDGRQTWGKWAWDNIAKVGGVTVSLLTFGWWRPWL